MIILSDTGYQLNSRSLANLAQEAPLIARRLSWSPNCRLYRRRQRSCYMVCEDSGQEAWIRPAAEDCVARIGYSTQNGEVAIQVEKGACFSGCDKSVISRWSSNTDSPWQIQRWFCRYGCSRLNIFLFFSASTSLLKLPTIVTTKFLIVSSCGKLQLLKIEKYKHFESTPYAYGDWEPSARAWCSAQLSCVSLMSSNALYYAAA